MAVLVLRLKSGMVLDRTCCMLQYWKLPRKEQEEIQEQALREIVDLQKKCALGCLRSTFESHAAIILATKCSTLSQVTRWSPSRASTKQPSSAPRSRRHSLTKLRDLPARSIVLSVVAAVAPELEPSF